MIILNQCVHYNGISAFIYYVMQSCQVHTQVQTQGWLPQKKLYLKHTQFTLRNIFKKS